MKMISVYVEDEIYVRLKEIAKEQDLPVTKVVKKVVKTWLETKKEAKHEC